MTYLRALRVLIIGDISVNVGAEFQPPQDRDWKRMVEVGDAEIVKVAKVATNEKTIVEMTTEERRAWFEARGAKYDARWSDARVAEAAHGLA